jgi:hypothetical protein
VDREDREFGNGVLASESEIGAWSGLRALEGDFEFGAFHEDKV